MRCSCGVCGVYMVHSEGRRIGCVCPACGARCTACLGTNTVLSRDALRQLRHGEPPVAEPEQDCDDVIYDGDPVGWDDERR